ncbi:MAG: ABC transporter substrate-binding protein [Lachnospiraceae bacterium]|nr:ABC transporter substrate-binding protein [Lachnospiraceae bacterium]
MKKKVVSVLLAMSVMALAACGNTTSGGDTGTQASGGASSAQEQPAAAESTEQTQGEASAPVEDGTQGVTDTEIKIANTAAVSGAYAPVGVPFNAGIQGYLNYINDQGGIGGRKITFVHKDDEFDPVKGKAYLQEMVEDEKVFAMVGHFGTPVVAATVEDLKAYGIPSVYFATGIGQLYAENATTNEEGYNIFPVQPIYTTEGQIMVARGVGTFNATKIGIIYTSDDAGKDMRDGATRKCDELGIPYVEEQVAAGAADVSAAVTSMKNAEVDFVVVAAIQATMPTIVKEMAAQGMNVPAITTYVNVSPAISEQVATDIKGKFDVYGNGWVSYEEERADNLALYQQWVDAEYAMNAYAQTGWIAASFFCEGVQRLVDQGKDITWTNYMQALEEAPIQNPFGGMIDYANGNRAGTQVMNLSKINGDEATGWELVDGLRTMDELLGN